MAKKLLVMTNMGPSKDNPFQGQFVFRQADAIRESGYFDSVEVFGMPALLQKLPSLFRYPLWMLWFFLSTGWRSYSHVHVHFFYPTSILAGFYQKLHPKTRLFATFHGTDVYAYQPPSQRYIKLLSRFEHLVFVSEKLRVRVLPLLQDTAAQERTSVISAGIPDLFVPAQANRAGTARDIDLLFVGHLDKNKGVDRLIDILQRVKEPLQVAVVGTGPMENALRTADLTPHTITMTGALTQQALCQQYQRARFLLNLSRNESFGLVMAEAMACGTPVIATPTDGSKEQINEGTNGFFISDASDKAVEQLNHYLSVPDWSVLSENAMKSGAGQQLDRVIKQLKKLYC